MSGAMAGRPVLVVLSGPPAAGKSSLLARLQDDLRLPALSKDVVKEALMAVLGVRSVADSERLGGAAHEVLYRLAEQALRSNGVIVESAFHRERAEPRLRPLVLRARTVVVHCEAPAAVLTERYRRRAATGGRDPGHRDLEKAGALERDLERGTFEPPDLGVPLLRVDTSDGYRPSEEEVLTWVRRHLG